MSFEITTKGTALLNDNAVHVEQTYEKVLTGVVITLSGEDARNLKAVCGAIAATGEHRSTTDRIWQALGLAGVEGLLKERDTGYLCSLGANSNTIVADSF